eukprot:2473878-Rhodomonas_salina.1
MQACYAMSGSKIPCAATRYRNLVGVTDHCPPYAPPLPRPDTHTHTRTHKRAPPAPHGPSERPKSDSAAAQPEEDLVWSRLPAYARPTLSPVVT